MRAQAAMRQGTLAQRLDEFGRLPTVVTKDCLRWGRQRLQPLVGVLRWPSLRLPRQSQCSLQFREGNGETRASVVSRSGPCGPATAAQVVRHLLLAATLLRQVARSNQEKI